MKFAAASSVAMVICSSSVAAQDDSGVDVANLCVATAEYSKQLGAIALAYEKETGLSAYMFDKIDEKLSQKADALSVAGGPITIGLLMHEELGLNAMRVKAQTCAMGVECDTSLFQQAIVFSDFVLTACREDAKRGSN